MIKLFTYFNSHLYIRKIRPKVSKKDMFFEPSEHSVKTILDFSRAYHPTKLKSCDENDLILN